MADITSLTPTTTLVDTDIIYLVTGAGTVDETITITAFKDAVADYGIIYGPVGTQNIGAAAGTAAAILGTTKHNTLAKGFTVDETTGKFTALAAGVGKLYKLTFSFASDNGPISNADIYAQLSYQGGTPVDTIVDTRYVATASTEMGVSGTIDVTFAVTGDSVSIELYGSTGTVTPTNAYIELRG